MPPAPPLWRRQQLVPGTIVKLVSANDDAGDGSWVRIDERLDGRYRATLGGKRIDFTPDDVDDWHGPTLPEVPATLTAAVTHALRDPNRFPRFVRRETPLDAYDSGLRLSWSRDDAGPSSRLPLRDVLVVYDSVAPLALVGKNGRWRWNDADCRYEPER